MKLTKKVEAIKLRKQGNSLSRISTILSVSKSTASLWVKDVVLSRDTQNKLHQAVTAARTAAGVTLSNKRRQREVLANNSAKEIFSGADLPGQYRYMLAALIYECEGAKTSRSTLEFTNSDPVLVAIFLKLIRTAWILDEAKFRVVMHLHSYHDETREKDFWSNATGIPKRQFLKTFKKIESGKVKKAGYRGCVQIKYFDVNIKRMLLAGKLLMAEKLGL